MRTTRVQRFRRKKSADEWIKASKRKEKENFSGCNNATMHTSSAFANDNKTTPSMTVYPSFIVHPAARRASWIIRPYLLYEMPLCSIFTSTERTNELVTVVRGSCLSSLLARSESSGTFIKKGICSPGVRQVGSITSAAFRRGQVWWHSDYKLFFVR